MSRSTSKKTGKSNNKGAQNKAAKQPVSNTEQKTDPEHTAVKPAESQNAIKKANSSDTKQTKSPDLTTSKSEVKQEEKQKVTPPVEQANSKPLSKNESLSKQEASADKGTSVDKKPSTKKELSLDKEDSNSKKSSTNKNSRPTGTETVQTTSNQQSSGKQNSGLSIFAIFLSLIALGLCGYQWYSSQINATNKNTQFALDIGQIGGQVTRISDSVARLKADQTNIVTQAELENKIITANSSFDKQFRDLEQSQESVVASVATINEELRKGANQYVLDEVSQLLRLGNNSAIFTNNAESAVNAFMLADIQLKELNNPRYAVVRRKINEEIQLLKSIEQVDSENVLAQLNFITSKVSSLPLENKLPVGESLIAINTPTNNDQTTTWRTEFKKMFSDIINSVSIQKVDTPPKALLAPRERYLLDQNLKLQLVKAEIALLQDNQTLYTNSITEATNWISGYFDPEDDLVKKILSQLTSLKKERLNTKLPAVSGSYDLLQTIKGGQ